MIRTIILAGALALLSACATGNAYTGVEGGGVIVH